MSNHDKNPIPEILPHTSKVEPKPEPKPEGPVLTQQTVDDGHLAAEGGMEGYLAFWNSQTKVTRNLLVNSGWHDVLKKEAMQADEEAAKEKGDSK